MNTAPPMSTTAPPARSPLPDSTEQLGEQAWIEVIQKMDEVYNDLLQYEVALEEKNAALEESHQFIESVLTSMSDILIVCDRNGTIEGDITMGEGNDVLKRSTRRSAILPAKLLKNCCISRYSISLLMKPNVPRRASCSVVSRAKVCMIASYFCVLAMGRPYRFQSTARHASRKPVN